jgi:hypothetical protein
VGVSALHTKQFSWRLGDQLAGGDIDFFKPLSPEDLYWETAAATHHFYGDFVDIIHMASEPIRSFYVNANDWQEEISRFVDRMDYFIVYVSSLTPSVLWEIELLERKQRAQHATVVFDADAIENKELQIRLQESLGEEHGNYMTWRKATDGPALSAEEVREQLARSFVVVSPGEFDATVDMIKNRIAEARGPVGPGAREAPLDFRFHPAVDADELQRIRDFDDELGDLIRELVSSRSITNLPWFLNQVQLKIFTTLMLGDHDGTGRALVIYAAVMDTVRTKIAGQAEPGDDVAYENEREAVDSLTQHYDTGAYVGNLLLSYGQSHEFGDYRARAKEVYDKLFAATTAAVDDFFDEVDRRLRA